MSADKRGGRPRLPGDRIPSGQLAKHYIATKGFVEDRSLTAERLRTLLSYDPETGVFTWRANRGGRAVAGSVAGRMAGNGYEQIRVDYSRYLSHRLAWLYVHGEWPVDEIDHINRLRADNRIANLRLASRRENLTNTSLRRDNTSGFKGVYWQKASGKWVAQISDGAAMKFLGLFPDVGSAAAAYDAAALAHFGEFALTNGMIHGGA